MAVIGNRQASPPADSKKNALVRKGDFWEVTYEGQTSLLEDTRGLHYIALLINNGHQGPLHAKELVALAKGESSAAVELAVKDPVMDPVAENRLIKRLEEIGFERNTASGKGNYDRVAALDEESDRIVEELERARAPHQRRSAFNDSAEKARKAVGKAIAETISKMANYPELGPLSKHLTTALQKGQWLSYNGTAEWQLEFKSALQCGSGISISPLLKK